MRGQEKTKEKLANQLAELRQRIAELEAIKNKHKQAEEALRKRTHDLGERVKEMNCLYGISKILEKPGISLEEILQGTGDLIPPAWQYPEITCARVILEDQEFRTEKFKETIWKQGCDIIVDGNRIGTLEVCYLEERRKSDEGPFLKEERNLINAIAERLGRIIERKRSEDALEKYTHDLGERVKEMNCLYGISKILEKPDISLEEILQGIVHIIPTSWQYPEITCARVILEDQEFSTKNFRETIWKQGCDIVVDGERLGSLEIFYLEEKPDCYEGPFLKEERSLIDTIAERLGRIIERKRAEEALQEYTHDLGERVKELNCLYGISKLLEKHSISLEEILQGTADLIPPAWQYPEITCARVILEDQEFSTKNFKETIWKQGCDIVVHGNRIGTLEVCYLEERPRRDEGPFLREERSLIDAIGERLGKIIERKLAEKTLRESEERYRVLAEKLADGVGITQDGRLVYVNDALCSKLGYTSNQLLGVGPVTVFGEDNKGYFRESLDVIKKDDFVEYWQGMCLGRDGGQLWIETHQNLITWEDKPAILFAIRDITEAHNREIAIKEEVDHLRNENIRLKSSIRERYRFGDIIGKSPAMQEVYELILKAAATNAAVTINGESGTGKELVARAIHDMSDRRNGSFVAVNCGAIPENLLESEFFGYRKGAFTGAQVDKNGFLDIADGGDLFLDEVGELGVNLQVKLLRAIEGGGYRSVGGTKTKNSDFRIISATNRDLRDLLNKGLMRDDFFYRLQVIPITLPPLRVHKEDIPLLVDHFLHQNDNDEKLFIPSEIMETLMSYDWPGNVRELQNVLHRYLAVKRLDFMDVPGSQPVAPDDGSIEEFDLKGLNFHTATESFERDLILKALERNQWHKSKAASMLSLPRRTFFRKLKYFGLTESHIEPPLAQS